MANEEFVATVLGVIVLVLIIIFIIFVITLLDVHGYIKEFCKLILSAKPKSGIDKEIAEEEKEIAELERQKEKMETLEELKRRKERLFNEVHSGTNADCQWCGEDDCLKPAYTVDGIAQYYCTSCHRWLNDGSSMV